MRGCHFSGEVVSGMGKEKTSSWGCGCRIWVWVWSVGYGDFRFLFVVLYTSGIKIWECGVFPTSPGFGFGWGAKRKLFIYLCLYFSVFRFLGMVFFYTYPF